jgi:BirA family biotin operon repressor/biotin-[acetyl-CoA-carboxylase] ligase
MQTSPTTPGASPAHARMSVDPPWTLHEYAELTSTNLVARTLPPWHAVRADTQTGGYGRTGRTWISDAGGLWLSAVLPTPGPREKWAILPLAAGWAVIEALESIGVGHLRLRWPNDILVGRRKLAGLLLEQFQPGTTVIGLGLNIANHPDRVAPELRGLTVALQELVPADYAIADIARLLLHAFAHLHQILTQDGFPAIAHLINLQWDTSRAVELSLNNGSSIRGHFSRIDPEGRILVDTGGNIATYAASEVALLRELD